MPLIVYQLYLIKKLKCYLSILLSSFPNVQKVLSQFADNTECQPCAIIHPGPLLPHALGSLQLIWAGSFPSYR